ncbi:hypothetical protein Pmani_006756 [Petrolisthes manimaculis]|uniref:Reverse transcriptase domain-containing protein n=1 Tax=Petrolisthes manimaculis TaxID=1843537 RepID=A0AAE1UJ88_9EUCA|nr:hypothetical protein Pmani_006756 [Petrolisthes manimaculis]
MREVLRGLEGVEVFVDDILIHSFSFSDHLRHLEQTLLRLQEAGLKVNPRKCEIDMCKGFFLRTDASGVGIEAVLMQYHHEVLWPVAYSSRKLKKAELNYSTVERELLAVIEGVRRTLKLKLATGTVVMLSEVRVRIDSPWLKGEVKAAVCQSPVYDLVVGGLDNEKVVPSLKTNPSTEECDMTESLQTIKKVGSTATTSRTPEVKGELSLLSSEDSPPEGCEDSSPTTSDNCVSAVTRGQARRVIQPTQPLKVTKCDFVSTSEFLREVESDKSLNSIPFFPVEEGYASS